VTETLTNFIYLLLKKTSGGMIEIFGGNIPTSTAGSYTLKAFEIVLPSKTEFCENKEDWERLGLDRGLKNLTLRKFGRGAALALGPGL